MNRKRIERSLIIATFFGGFLLSCSLAHVVIGLRETHLPGLWRASYSTFTGSKSDVFQADAGQTLDLEYNAQVDKGMLSIQVVNPGDEVVWEASLKEDQAETTQVSLDHSGRYAIRITGEETGGSWDLKWYVEK